MFCKIYISNGNISKNQLDFFNSNVRVITTSYSLYNLLHKNNVKCELFSELFYEISNTNKIINRRAFERLKKYERLLEKVKFNDFGVFSFIENQLFEELIFVEKILEILLQKRSTIFLFDRYSFSQFSIFSVARELGYETKEESIGIIKNGKITYIKSNQDLSKLEFLQKFQSVKNQLSLGSTLLLICKVIAKKISNILTEKKIFDRLEKKISHDTNPSGIVFFLTSDRYDLLKPIMVVIEKLNEKKIPHRIFTIDAMTNEILKKNKIFHTDLFDDIYGIMGKLRRSDNMILVLSQLEKISKNEKLSILYNSQFSKFFENIVCHGIAILLVLEQIVKKMEIKHIGVAIDGSLLGNIISLIADRYKIQTLSVESFYVNENIERLFLYKADRICIYGEQGKNALSSIGYDESRIVLTGNPRYDQLNRITPKESREMLYKHGISKEKKLIVVAMSRWHQDDEIWMSKLIRFCDKNNCEIIIKIHPMYKTRWIDDSRDRVNLISKSCKDLKYLITYDLDSTELITGSDIVITDYSNIGIEAILLDKILITVNFNHENLENTQQYHKHNASIHIENYSDLEEIILDILSKGQPDNLSEGKKKIIQLYNYYNDGNAAERIRQILTRKYDET